MFRAIVGAGENHVISRKDLVATWSQEPLDSS